MGRGAHAEVYLSYPHRGTTHSNSYVWPQGQSDYHAPVTHPADHQPHLDALRRHRVRPQRDESLAFIAEQFQREVARPFKQLGAVAAVWGELVPAELAQGARLESLQRGTLTVSVSSSAVLYELDRRLRDGLERELVIRHKGAAFRRVKLRRGTVGPSA